MQIELELNSTATAEIFVGPEHLASALSIEMGDEFPKVLATARMIGLMELAAGELGRGWHKRAIVASERLEGGAAKRVS